MLFVAVMFCIAAVVLLTIVERYFDWLQNTTGNGITDASACPRCHQRMEPDHESGGSGAPSN